MSILTKETECYVSNWATELKLFWSSTPQDNLQYLKNVLSELMEYSKFIVMQVILLLPVLCLRLLEYSFALILCVISFIVFLFKAIQTYFKTNYVRKK